MEYQMTKILENEKRLQKPTVHVPKVVAQNIEQLVKRQTAREKKRGWFHKTADWSTRVAGSSSFLLIHLLWFTFWILLNVGDIPGLKPFDPYPFGFLTFVVSLEAIALSVMVLMVQNQIQLDADRRAELDLHVNLLAESELTVLLRKLCRIEKKLGIEVSEKENRFVDDLLRETNPVDIEETIEGIS
jgi:uncharacterized membrane protein